MKFIYNNAWMHTNKTDRDRDLVLGNKGKKASLSYQKNWSLETIL